MLSTKMHNKIKAIRSQSLQAPERPGVYLFVGSGGKILYVGKAKNIRKRLAQHFSDRAFNTDLRKTHALGQIEEVQWFLTPTEDDAFFVENQYIKKFQPPFNVMLRDDKTFPYLRVSLSHPFPKMIVTRRVVPSQDLFIGPFRSGVIIKKIMNICIPIFKIRSCTDHFFKVTQRPCMEYQLGRCRAPCVGYETAEGYREGVQKLVLFLTGRQKTVLKDLKFQMMRLSREENFVEAGRVRNQIQAIESFFDAQKADFTGVEGHCDFVHCSRGKGGILHVRFGVVSGMTIPDVGEGAHLQTDSEMLSDILGNYGSKLGVPSKIFLPGLLPDYRPAQELIYRQSGQKPKMVQPRTVQEKRLMTYLAEQLLLRGHPDIARSAVEGSRSIFSSTALENLRDLCHLGRVPKRFECIDISHFQGKYSVGAVVVFDSTGPCKEAYRYYKVLSGSINDTAAIAEVCERRYSKHRESLPDVLLIDGGRGQVSAAYKVMKSIGMTDQVRVLGLSKYRPGSATLEEGVDRIHFDYTKKVATLRPTHPAYRFLTWMRDEAHRFCNSYQKRKFQKSMTQLEGLGQIKGLGKVRQNILRQHLYRMGMDGLRNMSVPPDGIPLDVWQRVKAWTKQVP